MSHDIGPIKDFLGFLYQSRDGRGIPTLGKWYKPPAEFPHAEDVLVATIPKLPSDGDGQPVTVYESRYPARFFKLVAKPAKNSMGKVNPGFEIGTGSGDEMADLIGTLALAVAEGMVGVRVGKP